MSQQNEKANCFFSDKLVNEKEPSLAEIFRKRKGNLVKKMEKQKLRLKQEHQQEVKPRSREEILQQRKEMMKRPEFLNQKPKDLELNGKNEKNTGENEFSQSNFFLQIKSKTKEPPKELMERLTAGKKIKVEKKEMLALTKKNFLTLPEQRKRREIDEKRENYIKRMENVKKLDKKLRCSVQKHKT